MTLGDHAARVKHEIKLPDLEHFVAAEQLERPAAHRSRHHEIAECPPPRHMLHFSKTPRLSHEVPDDTDQSREIKDSLS